MGEKQQFCQRCGTRMAYRLGEFECPQCGFVLSEQVQAKAVAEPAMDFGGVKRARLLIPPAAPGAKPPVLPEPRLYNDPTGYNTSAYGPGPMASHSLYTAEPLPRDSLWMEKAIYFWLQVAGYVLMLLLLIFASTLVANMNLPGQDLSPGASVAWFLFGGGVNIVLLWVVFFGDQMWAKWCCAGCTGIAVIGGVIQLFMVIGGSAVIFESSAPSGFEIGFVAMYVLVSVAMQAWLLSIVWRDIQRLQS